METSCWLHSQHEAARWERLARTPKKRDEDSMEAVRSAGIIHGNGEEGAALVWDTWEGHRHSKGSSGWGGDAALV